MTINETIIKCEKLRLEMALTDPSLSRRMKSFSFRQPTIQFKCIIPWQREKKSIQDFFLYRQTVWWFFFLRLKTYNDIRDDSQS